MGLLDVKSWTGKEYFDAAIEIAKAYGELCIEEESN